FIVLATGLVGTILQGISMVPFFVQHKIDLSVITSGRILQKAFDTHYKLFPLMWLILIACYMALPLGLTSLLFKNKELEF
nr:hypothetical protein [Lachnospiraceae bacterium]